MSDAGAIDYRLRGRVTFGNLVRIREEGRQAIARAGEQAVFDLSGLERGNSAAVALLMDWFRAAEHGGKSIRFVAPPVELENIVELSGLTDLLPLGAATAAAETGPTNLQAGT